MQSYHHLVKSFRINPDMHITLVSITLSFFLATISAVVTPTHGFLDFYANVQKNGQKRMIGSKASIIPLTRRLSPHLKSRSRRNLQTGDANLTASSLGTNFLAEVTFGTQTFPLVIDTGSSDTWVPATNVECVDPDTNNAVNQSVCAFGPLFQDAAALTPIPGIVMNQTYVSGEFMTGPMYLEQVTLGGLTINQTQVSIVTSAFWEGDGVNSGILGLSSPNTTAAVSTKNGDQVIYNPILTNMFNKNMTNPFFSLALDKATSGPAGYFVIGGLPPVAHDNDFTTVPIELKTEEFGTKLPGPTFTDYLVNVTGFSYNGKTGDTGGVRNLQMIVDSGTTTNVVPAKVAACINDLFTPPGRYNKTIGGFQVACNVSAPSVGIQIGNNTFPINPAATIFEAEPGICTSGWEAGGDPKDPDTEFFLGDVFLTNVVAVFDLGAMQMHFASRK
ncbi:uncharacterized protein PAC_02337 [Phialocephala subalpina]|uniref:Peptidase A1 domain-containing protein n=1 Tax=Phialocephala subalpina TaxID=576137 RepID=A0A1L7WI62_9HELO|nr:uncharacterized protein PAC_02337 [Phialocephala subalpina]